MATRSAEQIVTDPKTEASLAAIEGLLNETEASGTALLGPNGERLPIPESLYEVLRRGVAVLKTGESVEVVSSGSELTTQQAADLLNVSRPFLIKLLDRGDIAYRLSGTHRRIGLRELLRYRSQRSAMRLRALNEMAREADDLGIVMS